MVIGLIQIGEHSSDGKKNGAGMMQK